MQADPAMVKQRGSYGHKPLIRAIKETQSSIAPWLIEHFGDHDLSTRDTVGDDTLWYAIACSPSSRRWCRRGQMRCGWMTSGARGSTWPPGTATAAAPVTAARPAAKGDGEAALWRT